MHPDAPGHKPVLQPKIHAPTKPHAVDGEHLAHELVCGAVQRRAEGHDQPALRVEHRCLATPRCRDDVLRQAAAARRTLDLQPKRLAVDAHLDLHGLTHGRSHRIAGRGVERGIKRPRPALTVELHAEGFARQRRASQVIDPANLDTVDHDVGSLGGHHDQRGRDDAATVAVADKHQWHGAWRGNAWQVKQQLRWQGGHVAGFAHRGLGAVAPLVGAHGFLPVRAQRDARGHALAKAAAHPGAHGGGVLPVAAAGGAQAHGLLPGHIDRAPAQFPLLPVVTVGSTQTHGLLPCRAGGTPAQLALLPIAVDGGAQALAVLPVGAHQHGQGLGALPCPLCAHAQRRGLFPRRVGGGGHRRSLLPG